MSRRRVVGFVPSKLNSERLPRKNVLPLGGRPLVNWVLSTLNECGLDETVLYASDDEIVEYVESGIRFRYVERPQWLDTDEAKVQDFVGSFLNDVEGDIVVLLHVTSPFITASTVSSCIDAVASGRHESAFAALEMQRFAWYRGRPLNYSLDEPTPRTQDLDPVLVEQSGLYVFTRELFESTGRRIADDPYIHPVDSIEGHDIDTRQEFEIAEFIAATRNTGQPND
jgi:CMP-N-acetylneuraminic acid synthetase